MQQLEIEFFFPLTEQIDLDLDFTPCQEYAEAKRQEQLKNSITYTGSLNNGNGGTYTTTSVVNTGTFAFMPEHTSVGYWEIGKGLQMHNKNRPNWLNQKMTQIFFGWKWKDK